MASKNKVVKKKEKKKITLRQIFMFLFEALILKRKIE